MPNFELNKATTKAQTTPQLSCWVNKNKSYLNFCAKTAKNVRTLNVAPIYLRCVWIADIMGRPLLCACLFFPVYDYVRV